MHRETRENQFTPHARGECDGSHNQPHSHAGIVEQQIGYPDSIVDVIICGDDPEYPCILPNGEYLYVPNRSSNDVSVVRTSDNTGVATMPSGACSAFAVPHPNGQFVYVACRHCGGVQVIGF